MAIRGRKPKPTHLRLVTGNPGKRPINEAELQPDGAVEKPKFLKGKPAKVWDRYAPELVALGVLRSVDVHLFALWCGLAAEVEEGADKMVAARMAQYRALSSEFGIGASARSRIGGKDKGPKDPADKYLD